MDKGYPEFGYHLNRTGRPMIYACSWPVYQTYSGMTVRKRGRFADVATHTEKFNSLLPGRLFMSENLSCGNADALQVIHAV